ncbi:MAG: T9SS type A sorting domain-containing protein [Ignavibacteriales bacterium]|nr:T9SS type A sorting domain-containing protein [Ignavibacteriales bacterium]
MRRVWMVWAAMMALSFFARAQQVDYTTQVQTIFSNNCSCHLTANGQNGVKLSSYTNVINSIGLQYGKKVIAPGSSAASPLYEKISSASPAFGSQMPQGGPVLSTADITTIKNWIDQGAKANVTGVKELGVASPNALSLEQNFPNPFNPTTNFEFHIAQFGFVSLRIYDVLGREAAVLVNQTLPPGSYSVQWNASLAPSGSYFYRLEANGESFVRRMTLQK